MTQATINGNTYSDDGTAARDMRYGGHRTWLLPMLSDTVVRCAAAETAATNAAAIADQAQATSSTSLAVGTGSKTFTIAAGKQFVAGNFLMITRSGGAQYMWGTVTSYSSTSLVMNIQLASGTGTYTDWIIRLSGPQGAAGTSANLSVVTKTGVYTAVAGDNGKWIRCDGTFDIDFTAAATLGSGWNAWVMNAGTGLITLDPNAAETIDGAASELLYRDCAAWVYSDGANLQLAARWVQMQAMPILSTAAATAPARSSGEMVATLTSTGLSGATATVGWVSSDSLFFATTSASTDKIATSPDGVTWTLRTMPASKAWRVASSGTYWVATVPSETTVAKSSDGVTWSSGTALPGTAHASGYPAFVGNRCLVPASAASTAYYTDDGGSTWSTVTLPAALSFGAWSIGGLFVYLNSTTTYYTSATGGTGTWTSRSYPVTLAAATQTGVTADGRLWAIPAASGTYRYTTDGINWSDSSVISNGTTDWCGAVAGVYTHARIADYGAAWTVHDGVLVPRGFPGGAGAITSGNTATNGSGIWIASCATSGAALKFDTAAIGLFAWR